MTGNTVLPFALSYKGSKYVFGAYVPKGPAGYKGSFDCAEFIAYCNYQVFQVLYGTETNTLKKDDAYTGYFARDAEKIGKIISVEEAARTPGAMLLRVPKAGAIGHIAFSLGNGKTIEAHSTKYGVIESVVTGRRWDYGIILHGITYTENKPVITSAPKIVYRLKSPLMKDPFVEKLQMALKAEGYYKAKIDLYYGPLLQDAVVRFQKAHGLVADGEVMPGGEVARELNI